MSEVSCHIKEHSHEILQTGEAEKRKLFISRGDIHVLYGFSFLTVVQ